MFITISTLFWPIFLCKKSTLTTETFLYFMSQKYLPQKLSNNIFFSEAYGA